MQLMMLGTLFFNKIVFMSWNERIFLEILFHAIGTYTYRRKTDNYLIKGSQNILRKQQTLFDLVYKWDIGKSYISPKPQIEP